jgi:hypothetical protein
VRALRKFFTLLGIFVLVFSFNLLFYKKGLNPLDEGNLLHLAQRVLAGDMPYRDFFWIMMPLAFYLQAFLFKIFGVSVLVSRLFLVVLISLVAVMIYYLTNKVTPTIFALLASLLFAIWSFPLWNTLYYSWLALFWAFLGLVCFVVFLEHKKPYWLVASGAMVALSILSKLNIGGATVVALSLFLVLKIVVFSSEAGYLWKERIVQTLLNLLYLVIGALVILVPFVLYFYTSGALKDLIRATFWYPLTSFHFVREAALPIPSIFSSLHALPYWIPIFTYTVFGVYLIFQRNQYEVLFFLFGILIFAIEVFPRVDFPHLVFGLPPFFIINSVLISKLYRWLAGLPGRKISVASAVGALVLILAWQAVYVYYGFFKISELYRPYDSKLALSRATVYVTKEDKRAYEEVVAYIKKHTRPTEQIFVVPNRMVIYFLADRGNPTRFSLLIPGNFNEGILDEAIRSLERDGTRYIIYYDDFIDGRAFKDYARPLYDFIYRNYKLERNIDGYDILVRKEG